MTARTIKLTSIYVDTGDEVERVETVELADDLAEMDDEERDGYLNDVLYPLTGTGRTKGDAGYFAESVDGLDPVINMEWC